MVAPSLQGLPLLVYVNKQDLPTAMSAAEMVEKLTLDRAQSRKVRCGLVLSRSRLRTDV